MTKYAQQIFDLVLCSTEHPTAEQIFLQMKQENSKIAQATVYNNDLRIHYLCPACRKAQEQHENFER